MRVAVVHDYLTQRRGAERVVLSMMRAFPGARLLASVYNPDTTFAEFEQYDVETSRLNSIAGFRRDPRLALPLLPRTFSSWHVDADVVICSSSGWAHGVTTTGRKLVYCYNPPRWLYQYDDYVRPLPATFRAAFRALRPTLLRWDRRAAASADRYVTSSTAVRARIRSAYGVDATIVPPPVSLSTNGPVAPVPGTEQGFFLVVGGSRQYKNVSAVCRAFSRLPSERLVVVGGLPASTYPWPPSIRGLTNVTDAELRWLYTSCAAVVAASFEDFGLTPLEGNAFGKPALALRAGGFVDTLVPGVSGLFIERADDAAIIEAVERFRETAFDGRRVVEHAARYDERTFIDALRREVLAVRG